MKILIINAGSSTYKLALYELNDTNSLADPIWNGNFEYSQDDQSLLKDTVKNLVEPIKDGVEVVGHRIVHGGNRFIKPTFLSDDVIEAIKELSILAPLHNPSNVKGIEIAKELFPKIPQIGVFDTAFHETIPESHYTYAIPQQWRRWGIRRYGFHGISHSYCSYRAGELLNRSDLRMVTCHLGNGSSLTAVKGGLSYDTTMGFTPLEGVIMGTRSGSIDPGIIPYLQLFHHIDIQEIDKALNFHSGLKAICETSDYRAMLDLKKNDNAAANLAYEMLTYSLQKNIGSMIAALEGVDVLVFTGGIGENASELRRDLCNKFAFLGVKLDEEKNVNSNEDRDISSGDSTVRILVIHTREDFFIARACLFLQRSGNPSSFQKFL